MPATRSSAPGRRTPEPLCGIVALLTKPLAGTPRLPMDKTQSMTDASRPTHKPRPLVDLAVGDTVILTERDERMWHIRQQGGRWILTGKATGTEYEVPLVTGTQCQQQPDEQASHYCHECHAYDREAALP